MRPCSRIFFTIQPLFSFSLCSLCKKIKISDRRFPKAKRTKAKEKKNKKEIAFTFPLCYPFIFVLFVILNINGYNKAGNNVPALMYIMGGLVRYFFFLVRIPFLGAYFILKFRINSLMALSSCIVTSWLTSELSAVFVFLGYLKLARVL